MEPLERLLNLVGLLLETRQPLTFEQIRATLEPYGQEKQDTAKRMFERDKDVLRDYGVPLELVDIDGWGTEQGYVIPKDAYYLPEIAFTPQELGALLVAAQSGGEDTVAEQGARKLLYGADGGCPGGIGRGAPRGRLRRPQRARPGGGERRARTIAASGSTTGTRAGAGGGTRRGRLRHGLPRRALVPGGPRPQPRTRSAPSGSRGSRASPSDAGEGSRPPAGFRAADHVQAGPWAAQGEDRARVAFAPEAAWWASGSLAGAGTGEAREDGWVEVTVPMADEGALAGLILQFGPAAEALEPASLREEIVRRLEAARA